ncbi:hypothetical protein [Flavobacterium ajazii]|uniref:hypothetical protein n=1 Tax=Flavobacterium ajazii TaxID=2692318 RepID=UPI001FE559B4|nr:hypothetical protein [Flavobacterium ajazii]
MESIKIMYLIDDRFKMICDQYCVSKMKAERNKQKSEKYLCQQLENENLSQELEEEILFYIIKNI